jgi:glycosyltransferase involved in cell wall biosynthesis
MPESCSDNKKQPTLDTIETPFISIVIPVKNGESTIGECIDSIINSDYDKSCFEIIIVDDGSTDRTVSIVNSFSFSGLHLLFQEKCKKGPSAARNRGVSKAKGNIIVFTDADCRIHRDFLKEISRPFRDPRIISCGGMQLACKDDPPFARSVADFLSIAGMFGGYTKDRGPLADGLDNDDCCLRRVRHNPTCCSAYRKRVFEYLQFDESLWPGEDLDFDIRLKSIIPGMIVFNHKALVFHRRPRNIDRFLSMLFAYGRFSGGRLTRRYGMFRPLSWVPFVTLAGFYLSKKNKTIPFIIAAGLMIRIISLLKDYNRIIKVLPLIPAGFITWLIGFTAGFFEEGQ